MFYRLVLELVGGIVKFRVRVLHSSSRTLGWQAYSKSRVNIRIQATKHTHSQCYTGAMQVTVYTYNESTAVKLK